MPLVAQHWSLVPAPAWQSHDPDWLDKAIRIMEKQIQEMNQKQLGKEQSEMLLVQ
jgi:hypothetical protein